MSLKIRHVVLLLLIPIALFSIFSGWILEWLWLGELGYSDVFVVLKSTRLVLFVLAFVLALLYAGINFRILANRLNNPHIISMMFGNLNISIPASRHQKWLRRGLWAVALFVALVFALALSSRWDDALRFVYAQPFGAVDPVFGKDISFYLFSLPIISLVQGMLTALTFFVTFLLALAYFITDQVSARPDEGLQARPGVLNHLRVNAALWLATLAGSFWLSRYDLLYRPDGVVFGAGYTHLAIELPALVIASVLSLLLALFMAFGGRFASGKILGSGAALIVLVLIVGRLALPAAVQQFRVNPNELEIEQPYIENSIAMTRLAYGLDRVTEIDFPADDTLTATDIRNNRALIENIRLWDHRLLIQTYRQLQEIRPYYQFNTIGIDRYMVDGQMQQVMLAGRELADRLPEGSNSWVNRHLQYTHGYGMAMSPVNQTNPQGEPIMLIRDLPPVTHPDIPIENAAIYYGYSSRGYYIVNSGTEELHYPSGAGTVYHNYSGSGGIAINSTLRKLLFAWELRDINILLSDYIHPESRLQLWRGVQQRINRIAPFLQLDEDPYLVVHNGRMVWIQDAYTTSQRFPYADPHGNLNYMRNPVKVAVDAYEGSVTFYLVDDSDPIINLYAQVFPDMFVPVEQAPEGLANHFRYPVNLFEVQLEKFSRFHMTNPRVFYNDEDRWRRPFEQYAGQRLTMEPYYVLGNLPAGGTFSEDTTNEVENRSGATGQELEFMLISPLTPEGRNNMIAWMAARSDPEHYGQLVTYRLPKDRLIYGPLQIESRIDQDPEISRQLALWDQRGSRVIRGNLLVVPVENSFLYVEPVFLLADRDDIPQLQRVIVSVGDAISMQPTIQAALIDLFGQEAFPDESLEWLAGLDLQEAADLAEVQATALDGTVVAADPATSQQLREFRQLWMELRRAIRNDDWARYGELLEEIDALMQ